MYFYYLTFKSLTLIFLLSINFREKPDIVFLQEVIPVTYSYFEEHLPSYSFIAGGSSDYFTATLLYRLTVYFDGHTICPYPGTIMDRNMLIVNVSCIL